MSNYGAYDAGLPCKNPNCRSHGTPHPFCKCWGDYAEGGEVKSICSENKPHEFGCEYYSEPIDHSHAVSGYLANEGLHGLLKMGKDDPETALEKYDRSIKRGHKSIKDNLEKTFNGKKHEDVDLDKAKESIHDWISKGGITHSLNEELYKDNETQDFAKGGKVEKKREGIHGHPIEHERPEQNIMLNSIKGRTSNYLSSLKPHANQPKLAFDDASDQTQQKKSYERAIKIAAHPLGILDRIGKGTIEPEHIKHLNAMYPEMADHLQKKITEKITEAQLSGEKPSYKVRQGLSLFMGAPLSGEMIPANIQAAQAVFQTQSSSPEKADGNAPAKKTSALEKTSQSYLTADEAAASRQQKQ